MWQLFGSSHVLDRRRQIGWSDARILRGGGFVVVSSPLYFSLWTVVEVRAPETGLKGVIVIVTHRQGGGEATRKGATAGRAGTYLVMGHCVALYSRRRSLSSAAADYCSCSLISCSCP